MRLVRQLGEIETYLSIVTAAPGRGEQGPRAKGFGSRPPAVLDVIALLDERTEINGDGPDDVLDEVPNAHADMAGWLRILIEEHPDDLTPPGGLSAGVALLRSRCDWIVQQPWVDDFATDVARVHGALRHACRDDPPRPFAHCPEVVDGDVCGGWVTMHSDGEGAQCRSCRASWRRDQLLALMLRVEALNAG